jgi:hypothetical protein
MGKDTTEIEFHIQQTRAKLADNMQELENRVRSATDMRRQFARRPFTFAGLAFGGGMLLAAVIRRRFLS